jgi:hypothetical protein
MLAPGAVGQSHQVQVACGPKVSLLLWPKGYEGYALPNIEMFRGLTGPFGTNNLLTYAAAAKPGTLGFPSLDVKPECVDYNDTGQMPAGKLDGKAASSIRLACLFPKSLTVRIDELAAQSKRVRVRLSGGAVVADATVTKNGSRLSYSKRYCSRKQPLIVPTS